MIVDFLKKRFGIECNPPVDGKFYSFDYFAEKRKGKQALAAPPQKGQDK